MIEILTVCTGNICRSPLAEQLLTVRLEGLDVVVSSAGTRARDGMPMTPPAQDVATSRGVPRERAGAHAARLLHSGHLRSPDLVLAMARDHRRAIVELDPTRGRTTFTAREFARLAADVPDDAIAAAAAGAGHDPHERLSAALAVIAGRRGLTVPPPSPSDDDVVDPIGRSTATYDRSADELAPGLAAVERVVRAALTV